MSKIYFTNTQKNFSEVKKIEGTLGTSSKLPEGCFLFKEEQPDGEEPKMFNLRKVDAKLFFAKRYWYFVLLITSLSIIFLLSYPIVAILYFLALEALFYFGKPFSSYGKAKKFLFGMKVVAVAVFAIAGFKLFGSLENIDGTLKITQVALLGTIIAFSRFGAQGIYNKYRELYNLVEDCEVDEASDIFVWRKQI